VSAKRKLFWSFCCLLFIATISEQGFCAGLDCATLKAKIDDGLKAKGVPSYTLTVVPTSDSTTAGKVVGTCDGGAQKIVYDRSGSAKAAPAAPAPASSKPNPAK
jgi:Protein of unknown function (DUF1161)